MQSCLDSMQQFKKARLQKSDVPRTFLTKERRSENGVDNCSYTSSDYKTDSNTSIFPVCFYVIHNMSKRSIKDFFSVIQNENSGSNDAEGKLLDRIAWLVVKPLLRNIAYDDFTENSQAVAAPTQDFFPE